jgi:hypothetical protein
MSANSHGSLATTLRQLVRWWIAAENACVALMTPGYVKMTFIGLIVDMKSNLFVFGQSNRPAICH